MKRIFAVVTALAVVASGSLLMTGAAGAHRRSNGTSQGRSAADETIVVLEKASKFKFVDLGRKGDSLGDLILVRNDLYNDEDELVGRAAYRCVLQFKPDLQCDGVYKFTGRGDIVFSNVVDTANEDPVVGPVIGGDGEFAGISGQLTIQFQGDDELTTFELVHPK